jgi:S-adenosylmethionine hydrolase
MRHRIVTLTTDFGLKDAYVAEMKAAILRICPEALIIDITHEVEKYNVRAAAFVLASASPYFTDGTVHVAVIDPGVGTGRRAILVQKGSSYFIGPDNGVLSLAVRKAEGDLRIREIANRRLMSPNHSTTFHGRDVFAPAAAYLLNGTPLEKFGPEVTEMVMGDFSAVTRRRGKLIGEAIYVDGFGNIVTNISKQEIESVRKGDTLTVRLGKNALQTKFCEAYGDVEKGKTLMLIGSHNFLEIAKNQGNAAENYKTIVGEKVVISQSASDRTT